mmetsp:Transcript_9899/g.24425  ORF Transcript_9899/g.24425 Transcript_9899/m.24425 type:complete len:374 (-) Transcript_9899:2658-3779(-)
MILFGCSAAKTAVMKRRTFSLTKVCMPLYVRSTLLRLSQHCSSDTSCQPSSCTSFPPVLPDQILLQCRFSDVSDVDRRRIGSSSSAPCVLSPFPASEIVFISGHSMSVLQRDAAPSRPILLYARSSSASLVLCRSTPAIAVAPTGPMSFLCSVSTVRLVHDRIPSHSLTVPTSLIRLHPMHSLRTLEGIATPGCKNLSIPSPPSSADEILRSVKHVHRSSARASTPNAPASNRHPCKISIVRCRHPVSSSATHTARLTRSHPSTNTRRDSLFCMTFAMCSAPAMLRTVKPPPNTTRLCCLSALDMWAMPMSDFIPVTLMLVRLTLRRITSASASVSLISSSKNAPGESSKLLSVVVFASAADSAQTPFVPKGM